MALVQIEQLFERYGYIDSCSSNYLERLCLGQNVGSHLPSEKIGTIILDDGMQVELYKFNISFSFSFYCWEIGSSFYHVYAPMFLNGMHLLSIA